MEVPTIYKAHVRVQYRHFRILKFPLIRGIEWGLNRISWGFHEIELDSTELNMIYINEMYILYHGDFMGIFEPPEERKKQSNLKIVDIVFYRFGAANEDLNNASQLGEYPSCIWIVTYEDKWVTKTPVKLDYGPCEIKAYKSSTLWL